MEASAGGNRRARLAAGTAGIAREPTAGSTGRGRASTVAAMARHSPAPPIGWLAALLVGAVIPALLMLRLAASPATLALVSGPVMALGLMGMGILAAAAGGRFRAGVLLALLTGIGLIMLARGLGMAPLPHPFSTALALIIASISFAARGTLFARAYPRHGWALGLFVVAGEAAMLMTATLLPAWLLTLLPAQWASTAIQTAITGTGTRAAGAALLALAGTSATTLLVVAMWPRRWPYALMFTAWLALSALVAQRPAAPVPHADLVQVMSAGTRAP